MQRTMGESPGKSRRAKCTGARCVGPKSLDRTTRLFVPYVDIIKGRGRIEVAKLPIWGLTCGYFRDLWTEKSKLASMLVIWSPRGPRVPMAWGGCVGAAGYPMGCQIGRLTRHETPLVRPSQATKISKPNRFAYPFRSRPRGVRGSTVLNLRSAKTSSYRDTANLGFGVTPRRKTPGY